MTSTSEDEADHWISPRPGGDFALALPAPVQDLLVDLGGQLDALLGSDHELVRRVFPVAYAEDAEREAGYQALMRGELIERHRAGVELIVATAAAQSVSAEELERWMTTINAIRLVLGTALDVSEDAEAPGPDDERLPLYEIYALLNVLLDDIVTALSGGD